MTVFIVCCGDGSDGDEFQLRGIYQTKELADAECDEYERVEEWFCHDAASLADQKRQNEEWQKTRIKR